MKNAESEHDCRGRHMQMEYGNGNDCHNECECHNKCNKCNDECECPKCHRKCHKDWNWCPWCGHNFHQCCC